MKSDRENRLSIRTAARLMGVSEQFLRVALQRGIFSFGCAVQITKKKYTYFINKSKFAEELGIELE